MSRDVMVGMGCLCKGWDVTMGWNVVVDWNVMVGMGCHGRDGMLQQGHIRQRPAHKPTPIAFFILQVLYKTAWSESVGRDCAAFCAKKWV